jgi:hypothetical protein
MDAYFNAGVRYVTVESINLEQINGLQNYMGLFITAPVLKNNIIVNHRMLYNR